MKSSLNAFHAADLGGLEQGAKFCCRRTHQGKGPLARGGGGLALLGGDAFGHLASTVLPREKCTQRPGVEKGGLSGSGRPEFGEISPRGEGTGSQIGSQGIAGVKR